MTMPYNAVLAFAMLLPVWLAVPRPADGQVPIPADFAACNLEALKTAQAGTASPTASDQARADRLRASALPTGSPDGTAKAIESSNPHLHGMETEGAKDAMYQAAYRSCMRRKGF